MFAKLIQNIAKAYILVMRGWCSLTYNPHQIMWVCQRKTFLTENSVFDFSQVRRYE